MTDWSQQIGYNNIINLYSPCISFVKDTGTCVERCNNKNKQTSAYCW